MTISLPPRGGVAAVLSAVLPGLGQFYNRQWGKGAAFLLGVILLDAMLSVSAETLTLLHMTAANGHHVNAGSLLLRMLPVLAVALWSIVDAARNTKPHQAEPTARGGSSL
jgi:Family of unknown function (DUF5683)